MVGIDKFGRDRLGGIKATGTVLTENPRETLDPWEPIKKNFKKMPPCPTCKGALRLLTVFKSKIKPSTPASFHNTQSPNVVIGLKSNQFHEFW